MKKLIKEILLTLSVLVFLTGCQSTDKEEQADTYNDDRLTVVTTLFPQYDFARQIGGEYADVSLVLLPGMESHMYDPTPGDMIRISNADMFIYTGAEMEPWAQELAESVDMTQVCVVDASEAVTLMLEEDEDSDDHDDVGHQHTHTYDPHIWLDMENAIQMVKTIEAAFVEIDPVHADDYHANAQDYIVQLQALDEEIRTIVANGNRSDIVFGGRFAYGYFIHGYDLDYESVYDSCSADTEPSMAQMAAVIDYMEAHQVKYILYEELSTPNVARAIAETTGAQMLMFSTCHNVTKDEFESGITFIDLMQQNAATLKKALE
jgi:zinc transport system substrate-binding protein